MGSNYFVYAEDYTYDVFWNKGFSGQILLAKPHQAGLSTLLVKHELPNLACCEFIYSQLAQELEISVPNTYLMKIRNFEDLPFKTTYAVGIAYQDHLKQFSVEELKSSRQLQQDFAAQYALAVMFEQADRVQMAQTKSGHIVGFDFSDSFRLSDLRNASMVRQSNVYLKRYLDMLITAFSADDFSVSVEAGIATMKNFLCEEKSSGLVVNVYFGTMRKFCEIPKKQIESIITALEQIYPKEISEYFRTYIEILQRKIERYLD